MSGTNARLIEEARAAANMGREYAENYSGVNPPDSAPWQNADLIDKMADALEASETAKYAVELRDSARAERDRFAADWVAASLRANAAEAERDAALGLVDRMAGSQAFYSLLSKAEAERDAALAIVAELTALLPDFLDSAESALRSVDDEWGRGDFPDDDEDVIALNALRAILAKVTK